VRYRSQIIIPIFRGVFISFTSNIGWSHSQSRYGRDYTGRSGTACSFPPFCTGVHLPLSGVQRSGNNAFIDSPGGCRISYHGKHPDKSPKLKNFKIPGFRGHNPGMAGIRDMLSVRAERAEQYGIHDWSYGVPVTIPAFVSHLQTLCHIHTGCLPFHGRRQTARGIRSGVMIHPPPGLLPAPVPPVHSRLRGGNRPFPGRSSDLFRGVRFCQIQAWSFFCTLWAHITHMCIIINKFTVPA
jgi:hypothetical protein